MTNRQGLPFLAGILVVLLALAGNGRATEMRLETARLTLSGQFTQGGLITGRTAPGTVIRFAGRTVRVSGDGLFIIGFHRDDPAEMTLEARFPDGETDRLLLPVTGRQYDIQPINGLPQNKVTPPESVLARIRADAAAVRAVRNRDSDIPWFTEGFDWPARGRISGVYGSQRILNGTPAQPHYGVDIAAPAGTPVTAPASGTVTLAQTDMYYSGGTVILDHGHGLASAFLHLQRMDVKAGDVIRKGDPIGTIGATGRATGAHLDWRINWFDRRLDPALLVPPMPSGTE